MSLVSLGFEAVLTAVSWLFEAIGFGVGTVAGMSKRMGISPHAFIQPLEEAGVGKHIAL